ncbi:HNH endonuclease signature motif containing protein [Edaphobacter paludis]|uniref:HNH endonuclease signature motif containing protein n=1 Tax=Edaphobacter paludis TaxID=3035702 RepID=A0AAU7DBQ0_9BACT
MSANLLVPETLPGFITTEEAHKAAYDNGFRVQLGKQGGWSGYRSTTACGEVWIARDPLREMWLLALTHSGVVAELPLPRAEVPSAPGQAAYAFSKLSGLYDALDRGYKLGVSLPDAPLEAFRKRTASLPSNTETERLTVVRIGQNIFRDALLEYWNGRCPLTGITDPALLRASHIVPWAECESDELRLDVHNGLLLSALWDCAFDSGLISISDVGVVLRSDSLSDAAALALRIDSVPVIAALTYSHRQNLKRHRSKYGFSPETLGGEKV